MKQTNLSAVPPFLHPGSINFKRAPYEAWARLGGRTAPAHYPPRWAHAPAYRLGLPTLPARLREAAARLTGAAGEARLRFVEPVSVRFDTFPDHALHEIVPMVWDCWPCHFGQMCRWMEKHRVRAAVFTASQTAARMRERFPGMNILCITEGVDTSLYKEGKPLAERTIGLLEFGRSNRRVFHSALPPAVNHVCTRQGGRLIYTNEQLFAAMADARVTLCLPRCDTQPEVAGGIETLTQRYWEAMLSRMVIVGRAPRELTRLLGYDPVIPLDPHAPAAQIQDILAHIADYQPLADRNRAAALAHGGWEQRMRDVMEWLEGIGYRTR